jgi:hypothetical protein
MMLVVVGVIVVVVIVALAGLYAAGVGPFSKSGSGSPAGVGSAGPETYSQAAAQASSASSGVAGGPWTLEAGIGIISPISLSSNASNLNNSGDGCTQKVLPGDSVVTTFPSTNAAASSGTTTTWLIELSNASGWTLDVAVFGGTATPLTEQLGFGSCESGLSETASLPAGVIDSPAAASAAMAVGGDTYASGQSSYFVEYFLTPTVQLDAFGSKTTTPGFWLVSLTNCDPSRPGGSTTDGNPSAQFTAELNATTGKLISSENSSIGCGGTGKTIPGGGGGGGGGGKPTFLAATDTITEYQQNNSNTSNLVWYNNATFGAVSGVEATSLTLANITVQIENNTTGAVLPTTGWTLQLTNFTTIVSTYDFGTNTWSHPGQKYGNDLSPYWFELNTSTNMTGDKIVWTATATAPVTGSISSPIGAWNEYVWP